MSELRTLVLIKPDAIERRLVGEIIKQYEDKGLKIEKLRLVTSSEALLKKHYEAHKEKSFFEALMAFMTSGPIIAMILVGEDAISKVRKLNGATNPKDAEVGSIRGHYGTDATHNLVHGSDSEDSAHQEIEIWFQSEAIE